VRRGGQLHGPRDVLSIAFMLRSTRSHNWASGTITAQHSSLCKARTIKVASTFVLDSYNHQGLNQMRQRPRSSMSFSRNQETAPIQALTNYQSLLNAHACMDFETDHCRMIMIRERNNKMQKGIAMSVQEFYGTRIERLK